MTKPDLEPDSMRDEQTRHQPAAAAETNGGAETEELRDRQLGDFRLIRRLGRGGMAEVYLADQISLRRPVAVKVLRKGLVADSDDLVVRRFQQEAHAAAALSHPNIIQVYSIGEEDGIHFIAQEYVQGMNLREYLSRKGPPDLPLALHILRQAAAALQAAGEAGIVHRDIKPENIMITPRGKVKVADFGLARLSQGSERVNLTQVGVTMGTPLYMSPEQVSGKEVDRRSDLYSLGVTGYHMLAGRPPFRGETALNIAVQHVNNEPPPLAERRPDLPPPLCQIIHKLMAKRPDGRYPDAQALLNDLKRVAQGVKTGSDEHLDVHQPADKPVRPARRRRPGRLAAWPGRKPVAAFLISCLLVGTASAGLGWLARPANPLRTSAPADLKVPRQETAAAQFMTARFLQDDEDAWLAVIEYFPDDLYYKRSAQIQLGLHYLRSRRLNKAEAVFDELAMGDADVWRVAGRAGAAVINSLRGDHIASQRIIGYEIQPKRELLDPEMTRLVREAIAHNRTVLGDEIDQKLEDLFRRDPPEDPESLLEEDGAEPQG